MLVQMVQSCMLDQEGSYLIPVCAERIGVGYSLSTHAGHLHPGNTFVSASVEKYWAPRQAHHAVPSNPERYRVSSFS
jgi:hypothetical protein